MNKKIYILLLALPLLFSLYYWSYDRSDPLTFTSPHHNADFYFSNLLITENSLAKKVPYYDILPKEITLGFTIRDGVQNEGFNIPKRFVMPIYLTSVLINFDLLLYFVPLASLFLLLAVFLFVKKQWGLKPAIISSLLASLFPAFWINSIWPISDTVVSFFFLFLGIFYLYEFKKKEKNLYIYLSLIFIAFSLCLRPTTVFFVAFLPIILKKQNWRKILDYKTILISLLIIFIVIFPLFYLNYSLYGSPIKTGYNIASNLEKDLLGNKYSQNSFINAGRVLLYVKGYFSIFLLTLVLFFLAFVYFFRNKIDSKLLSYLFLSSLSSIVYFGSERLWGIDGIYINSSFLRYILPIFIISFMLLSVYISKLPWKISILIILILISNYSFIALTFAGGVMEQKNDIYFNYNTKKVVLEKTPSNSIIISALSGKYLFPEREVITVSFWASEEDLKSNDEIFWKIYPGEKELSEKINALYEANPNLFILKDQEFFNDEIFEESLKLRNLNLNLVDDEIKLYRIENES